ncbi:MAG: hypothetical protein ACYSTI_12590, partial [Planctomycetota bacterium]
MAAAKRRQLKGLGKYDVSVREAATEDQNFWTFAGERYQVDFKKRQEAIAKAGKGDYVTVGGEREEPSGFLETLEWGWKPISDVFHNLGQWDANISVDEEHPYTAGELLTTTGHMGAAVFDWVFVEPPKIVKKPIGETWFGKVKEDLGVDMNDPGDREAWDAALGSTYSAMFKDISYLTNAYEDAKALNEIGALTFANKEIVSAANSEWWIEAIGEAVFDPANVVGFVGKGAKGLKVAAWTPGARKMMTTSAVVKGTTKLQTTAEVMQDLAILGTKRGQIKEAAGLMEKTKEVMNLYGPRFQASIVHRNAERIADMPSHYYTTTYNSVLAELRKGALKGVDTSAPEFMAEVGRETSKRFQDTMMLWSKMGSSNQKEVEQAAKILKARGFGDVPTSVMGRRTGIVLNQLMDKSGEQGDLLSILSLAKKEGLGAEHVSAAFYDKAARVMNEAIPKGKWESDWLQYLAKKTPIVGVDTSTRRAITSGYSKLFMGWSIGYAMRNFYDNCAKLVVNGVNPFQRATSPLMERTGMYVTGSERAIGQIGGTATAEEVAHGGWGAQLAQKGESAAAIRTSNTFVETALDHYWPAALKQLDLPKKWNDILKNAAKYDISLIDELAGDTAKLGEPWRRMDDVVDLIDATEPAMKSRIAGIMTKAETPEDALASLRIMQEEALEHLSKSTDELKAMGPAQGTLAGHAVELGMDSGRIHNLEQLGETLSNLEHTLQMSRNKALTSAMEGVNPDHWSHYLRSVEEVYQREVAKITRRQLVGYAQVLTGRLDEAGYSKYLYSLYSKAFDTLDKQYTTIIESTGKIAVNVADPRNKQRLLNAAVSRSAYSAGYPSIVPRGLTESPELIKNIDGVAVPDAHFINKIRKLLRDGMGLSDDQARTIKSVNDLDADQMVHIINEFTGGAPRSVDEILEWAGRRVDQATLDEFGPLGTRPMRATPDVRDPDALLETLRTQQDEIGNRMDDIDAAIKKAKNTDEQLALQATKRQLAKEFDNMNNSLDDLVAQASIREMEVIAQATGDAKTMQALSSIKMADDIPARSPAPLDSVASSNGRIIETLDSVMDSIKAGAKLPAEAVDGLPMDVINKIKGAYHETWLLAKETGRRGRDWALLDYSDRRYLDPLMQFFAPWHYWWSRSTPNWAVSLAQRPEIVSKYMNAKQHLRDYTDTQKDIPEWAKEQVPIRVPGYGGTIYWDYDGMFNAVGTIFDTFEDEDRTHDSFGKLLQKMGNFGPALHPMWMAAYAAERGLQGDTTGMRSYGYLSGHTRMFSTFTGKVLEPWLWLRDPVTNELLPFEGATRWDIEKATKRTAYGMKTGEVPLEAGMIAAATHAGPTFKDMLGSIQVSDPNAQTTLEAMAGYRRMPTLLSNLLGLRVSVKQDWETELDRANREYSALKATGQNEMAAAHLDANPWMSAVWMAWDNDQLRMETLAKNVLHRLPPMPGDQRKALLEKAGLSETMMDMWYADTRAAREAALASGEWQKDSPLANWDKRDYNNFATAILNAAEVLGIPSQELAGEWKTARKQWSTINSEIDEKYPTGREDEQLYFQVLEAQGKEAAREMLQLSPVLSSYWRDKNFALKDAPLVLKYYKDPQKIDTIANSLSWDSVEQKYGADIFDLRRQQQAIPDNEWWTKREFRRQHPEVSESYDYQKQQLL